MHEPNISFVPLLVVTAVAFLVPLLLAPLKRAGIPVVVGEIVAGILFGNSGLGLIKTDYVLQVLSVFGFAYLMFLSGLEINFSEAMSGTQRRAGSRSSLRRKLANPFIIGAMVFVLAAGTSVGGGFFLARQHFVSDPWIMALILSTTSLGVVAPVLKERELVGVAFGQAVLVSALIADFVTILLISAYVLLRTQGLTTELLLVLVLFAVFVAVYRLAARVRTHLPAQRIMRALSTATAQIRVRGSFAVALIFIALAESLGTENILGAFLAGVIISLLSGNEGTVLREKLDAIGYGFFIPIFFIMVGVKFNLDALIDSPSATLLLPILLGIAYGVKFISALALRFTQSWRETFAAGALLSARLSLIIAAASIGLQIHAISAAVNSAIVLVAVITCTFSPMMFALLLPKRHQLKEHVMVVGSSPETELLANRLRKLDLEVVRVEYVRALKADADESDLPPQVLSDTLRTHDIERAKTVVTMAESTADNLYIARIARELHGVQNVVAWVQNPKDNPRFREAGARIVNPDYSTLLIIEGMVMSPGAFSAGADLADTQEIRVVKLQNQSLVGRKIKTIRMPDGAKVLRIQRTDAILLPHPETVVRANDTVTVTGEKASVDAAARLFSRRW